MKYEKPQITCVGEAGAAIQAPHVKGGMPQDSLNPDEITVAAYPADE